MKERTKQSYIDSAAEFERRLKRHVDVLDFGKDVRASVSMRESMFKALEGVRAVYYRADDEGKRDPMWRFMHVSVRPDAELPRDITVEIFM